jgi:AraC-like DNA-binding protein
VSVNLRVGSVASYACRVQIGQATFRRLVRARELLESEAHDSSTVRAVARRVGLSPFHFIRQFAALYGMTPHQLRTRARLDRAKQLLGTGAPVTEVCLQVGFASLGSFSALFRRCVGTSPMRYRQSVVRASVQPEPALIAGCFGLLAALPSSNSEEVTGP